MHWASSKAQAFSPHTVQQGEERGWEREPPPGSSNCFYSQQSLPVYSPELHFHQIQLKSPDNCELCELMLCFQSNCNDDVQWFLRDLWLPEFEGYCLFAIQFFINVGIWSLRFWRTFLSFLWYTLNKIQSIKCQLSWQEGVITLKYKCFYARDMIQLVNCYVSMRAWVQSPSHMCGAKCGGVC